MSKVAIFHKQVLQVLFWQALPYKEEPFAVRLESARESLYNAKPVRIGIVPWNSISSIFSLKTFCIPYIPPYQHQLLRFSLNLARNRM